MLNNDLKVNYTTIAVYLTCCVSSSLWQLQTCYRYVPRSVVQKYVSLCPTCQLKKPQSVKAPLKPIIANGFLSRLQVDDDQAFLVAVYTV